MKGHPWTFDGHLFSLADFDGETPPHQLEFEKVAFGSEFSISRWGVWARRPEHRIGSTIGEVDEVEVNENGVGWGEYLRVQIVLDLSKPLSRGRFLKLKEKTIWVKFQYKKNPKILFQL
jgi:hypothetical protein